MNLKAENLTIEYLDRLTICEVSEVLLNRSEDILKVNEGMEKLEAFLEAAKSLGL